MLSWTQGGLPPRAGGARECPLKVFPLRESVLSSRRMPHLKNPKLSIILIGYNSKKFLKHCLKGVESQTEESIETYFIDNASADDSVAYVSRYFPWVKVIDNPQNIGYVGAANQGIRMSHGKYVMILNPDLILTPDYIKLMLERMESDKKIGAITGKVIKYDFEKDKPTDKIDTTGLYCFRNRRIIDRGQGLIDEGQYDEPEEVFGVSGAVPIYRREALEDTKLPMLTKSRLRDFDYQELINSRPPIHDADDTIYEYLDEDFFMYKEDIDISWRLRLRGWKCFYDPTAVCYHGRGTGVLKRFTHWQVFKGRKSLSRFQKYYPYKNQRLMQVKNELWGNVWRDVFPIIWKEIIIFGYLLFLEPFLLKSFFVFWWQFPNARKKRRLIMARRKVSAKQMAHWVNGSAKA
jgi:GT2 family glycosyltransferase